MKSERRRAHAFGQSWLLVAFLSLSIVSVTAAILTLPQTQLLLALYFAIQLCADKHIAGAVAFGHCAACWTALASLLLAAASAALIWARRAQPAAARAARKH